MEVYYSNMRNRDSIAENGRSLAFTQKNSVSGQRFRDSRVRAAARDQQFIDRLILVNGLVPENNLPTEQKLCGAK